MTQPSDPTQPVTAQTFKHSIERALSRRYTGWADVAVTDITGESAFRAGKSSHISGIVASDSALRYSASALSVSFIRVNSAARAACCQRGRPPRSG